MNRFPRVEINHNNFNHALSTIFTMCVVKMLSAYNFLVKNKILVEFELK